MATSNSPTYGQPVKLPQAGRLDYESFEGPGYGYPGGDQRRGDGNSEGDHRRGDGNSGGDHRGDGGDKNGTEEIKPA
jgi:hypothetical protein